MKGRGGIPAYAGMTGGGGNDGVGDSRVGGSDGRGGGWIGDVGRLPQGGCNVI